MCLCVDIVLILSELLIGGDQEEPICEEEDTPFVEEGKWLSPSAFSILNLYHCMLKQLFTILVAMQWANTF
jgi:hypothetical protein